MEGRDDGLLVMSAKERERLVVIRAVCERRLLQAEAAERLDLSVRQIKRLAQAWRTEGAKGLVSRLPPQPRGACAPG